MIFMKNRSFALVLFVGLMVSLLPETAHAQMPAAGTLGAMIVNIQNNGMSLAGLFSAFAYLTGLLCGVLGIKKLKDHVENPNSVPLADPMKRFIAGGAFFALPFVMDVVRTTIEGPIGVNYQGTGFNGDGAGDAGLDAMIIALMANVFLPLQWIFQGFGYLAGTALVLVGISRLLKTEQDGPRGPAGIGTITTFLMAGALFSLNSVIMYLTGSVFGNDSIQTNAVLEYTDGLGDAAGHVHAVISSIIAFSMIIGWISLIRGIFIMRGVSEGNSQASMMAALTHVIGGVLAINLGPVINAVQATLNIAPYGLTIT